MATTLLLRHRRHHPPTSAYSASLSFLHHHLLSHRICSQNYSYPRTLPLILLLMILHHHFCRHSTALAESTGNCTVIAGRGNPAVIVGVAFGAFTLGFLAGLLFALQKCHAQRNGRTISRTSLRRTFSNSKKQKHKARVDAASKPIPPFEKSKLGSLLRDTAHHAVHFERGLDNFKRSRDGVDAHAKKLDARKQAASLRLQRRMSLRSNSNNMRLAQDKHQQILTEAGRATKNRDAELVVLPATATAETDRLSVRLNASKLVRDGRRTSRGPLTPEGGGEAHTVLPY
jgi:hypothetical protein